MCKYILVMESGSELGRVHMKTGLVTQTGFIQTCCVQTSAVKAC